MHSRRKPAARPAGRQATIRSIARRRRYRRSDRPSCVRSSGRRLLRCGVISSMPRAANARSSASLSQALSPTTRSGTSFVRMKSNNPCTKVDSCGRAGQLCTAMGHPRASTAIRILTPLPTFVRPIPSPPPRAGENAASRKHSHSRYSPCCSTSWRVSCDSRSNTPSRTSRWKNRCTALCEPNSRGRSFHLAPLSNNQKIPASALHLSVRGQPPLGFLGRSGMRAQKQSNSISASFSTAGKRLTHERLSMVLGTGSKWHVAVRLREPVPGVLALGVGRHVGVG